MEIGKAAESATTAKPKGSQNGLSEENMKAWIILI